MVSVKSLTNGEEAILSYAVDIDGDAVASGGGGASGSTARPTVTLTLSNGGGAYAANDRIGGTAGGDLLAGIISTNAGQGVITAITCHDKDDVGGTLELWFFDASPTLAADNAAFSLADDQLAKAVAVVRLTEAYDAVNGQFLHSGPLAVPFKCASGADDLYVAVKAVTGGTYSDNGLVFQIHVSEVTVA
jgi:hypothetical protein